VRTGTIDDGLIHRVLHLRFSMTRRIKMASMASSSKKRSIQARRAMCDSKTTKKRTLSTDVESIRRDPKIARRY
jgi:hypothetical protein